MPPRVNDFGGSELSNKRRPPLAEPLTERGLMTAEWRTRSGDPGASFRVTSIFQEAQIGKGMHFVLNSAERSRKKTTLALSARVAYECVLIVGRWRWFHGSQSVAVNL